MKLYGSLVLAQSISEFGFDFEKEGLKDTVSFPASQQVPIRGWFGIIRDADLFIGCDSVGQHMAYAMDKPAVVVTGSTYGVNISYPNYDKFSVLDMGGDQRLYDPIRVTPDEESARRNDGIMAMNDKVELEIMKSVDKLMNKYYTKPEFEVQLPEQMGGGCGPQGCPPQQGPSKEQIAMMQKDSPHPQEVNSEFKIPALKTKSNADKGFSDLIKNK